MNNAEQHKMASLDRGLFFINYKSADDSLSPPHVTVAPAEGHERRMEIILHPDATEPTLREPNSGLGGACQHARCFAGPGPAEETWRIAGCRGAYRTNPRRPNVCPVRQAKATA